MAILTSFVLPRAGDFPVILLFYLNDSDFAILLLGSSL